MKQNLEHKALPTAEEIKLYQEGKLEPLRSHEVELLAQENPLLADALEGYASIPAFAMLPDVSSAISQQVSAAAAKGVGAKGFFAAVKSASWWNLNTLLIAFTATVATIVGVYFLLPEKNVVLTEIKSATNQTSAASEKENADVTLQNTQPAMEIAAATAAPETMMGTTENEASAPIQNEADTKQSTTDMRNAVEGTPIQKTADDRLPDLENNSEALKNNSSMVAIKIMKILNYKLADYTQIRTGQWPSFAAEDAVGVPASYADQKEMQQAQKGSEKKVSYVNYAGQCIKAFDEGQYDLAVEKFSIILQQYPDDVNAQFYTAMSFYHREDYERAEKIFTQVDRNYINTFDEEALYYRALCLKKLQRTEEANALFSKVVMQNNVYSARAAAEMQ